MKRNRSVRELLASTGRRGTVHLTDSDASATHGMSKKRAAQDVSAIDGEIFDLQTRLYAESKRALLIVLQGMDTSGKDGTITHVFGHFNPIDVHVTAFKQPTPQERKHNFLWRIRRALPGPGQVAIFNRSHYEDVLVAKVMGLAPSDVIEQRYGEINRFEEGLQASGTTVLKFFLQISWEEQRQRLLERLARPDKRWKFSEPDLETRDHWDDYQAAYELVLERCSAPAPWYVVPADRKWLRNWAISQILVETLREMDPQYPQPRLNLKALRAQLRPDRRPGPITHP
jgi:PPK2 family polyphosphate:nucleotide phosphotransferase